MSLRRFVRHCCPLRMSLSPRFLSVLLEGHQQANMRCMCRETKPWMVLSKCGYQVTVETWAQQTNSWISSFWSGNHKVVGRSLDEIASFSWFNLRVSGESGQGLLSRGFAELQRRAFERWEKQPWTPWDSGFWTSKCGVFLSFTRRIGWVRDKSGDFKRGFQTFSMTSLRQFPRSAEENWAEAERSLIRPATAGQVFWVLRKKTSTSEETYIIQWKPWHDDRFDSWEKDVYDSTHSRDRTDIILDRRA